MEEIIVWHRVEVESPDEGLDVLLFVPDSSHRVWSGVLDSGEWFWSNGSRVEQDVHAWAEFPNADWSDF